MIEIFILATIAIVTFVIECILISITKVIQFNCKGQRLTFLEKIGYLFILGGIYFLCALIAIIAIMLASEPFGSLVYTLQSASSILIS